MWTYEKQGPTGNWSPITLNQDERPTVADVHGRTYLKKASGTLEGPIRNLRRSAFWRYERLVDDVWRIETVEILPKVTKDGAQTYLRNEDGSLGDRIRNLHSVSAMPEEPLEGRLTDLDPPVVKADPPDEHPFRQAARIMLTADSNPEREGLTETPARFEKAWQFLTSGYAQDVRDVLKTFEDGAEGVDQMVVVKDIPFFSMCEHHMLPFFGTVAIGYLPQAQVVGLSKFARLTEVFARRFQVQERMTNLIAESLFDIVEPLGCGVYVKARHLCMEARGIQRQGAETITTALRGNFYDPQVRNEFLQYVS